MAIDYTVLKTELTTDPNGYGFAAHVASGTTWKLAEMMNEVRGSISVYRSAVPAWEIVANTVKADYDALTAGDKQLYGILVSTGTLDTTDARVRSMFASIFGAGTTTRTNLVAMASRNGSRSEQLFNQSVSSEDCSKALRS